MSKEHKDYIKGIEGAERRTGLFQSNIEVRAAEDQTGVTIEGYAAKFNSETTIGSYYPFKEVIAPGAFDDVLADDCRALFNHDPNFVLARTTAGTLKLEVDANGLKYSYQTPDVSYAKDLAENIRLGNVSQSSFAFSIAEEEWIWAQNDGEVDKRIIKKFARLYDVSPVTYPAYQDTEVAARSAEAKRPENTNKKQAAADYEKRERQLTLMGVKK